jgi:acyl-[acyl carrier protein]--UDP-N-acetylglucosamine O-acyltransferase
VKIEGGAETGPEVEAGAAAVVKAEVSTGTEREVEVQAEGQTEKGAGRERETDRWSDGGSYCRDAQYRGDESGNQTGTEGAVRGTRW